MSVAERVVRHNGNRAQYAFALEAKAMLPACDRSVLAASHVGLHVLALDEAALRGRVQDVREAYGPAIELAPPPARRAKLLLAARIGLQRHDLPAVRAALVRRGANPSEEYAGLHYCVLRFQAPLPVLLGLPGELAALSGATATHTFQPVPDRPSKRRTEHAFPDRYEDRPRSSQPAR